MYGAYAQSGECRKDGGCGLSPDYGDYLELLKLISHMTGKNTEDITGFLSMIARVSRLTSAPPGELLAELMGSMAGGQTAQMTELMRMMSAMQGEK